MYRHVWKYTDVLKSRKKKKTYPQKIYLCCVLFTINIILQLTYYKHKKNIISGSKRTFRVIFCRVSGFLILH